uniref:Uncharacterized protein n=1 Tax=Arundo donax TaxID=35708 RepID=A0A0A9F9J1_ARUDO
MQPLSCFRPLGELLCFRLRKSSTASATTSRVMTERKPDPR